MRILFFLLFCLSVLAVDGQSYTSLDQAKKKAVKAYNKAMDASMGQRWEEALDLLEDALKVEPRLIDAILQQGAIWYDTGDFGKAEEAFGRALKIGPNYDPFVWYQQGMSLMRQNKFQDATYYFQEFIRRGSSRDRLLERAKEHLAQCRFSAAAIANPVPFAPSNLGKAINTPAPEYLPSLTADQQTLVFTRVVNRQEDLYYSRATPEGGWTEARPLDHINTAYNEGAHSISADGRVLLFTACHLKIGLGSCDLYYSEWNGKEWSTPRNLGAPVNSDAWESQPTLSANGQTLYFASNRSGGNGGNDIWKSERRPDGQWSAPVPLSDSINSAGNDQSPFIHPDGQSLYFMSDGHQGMGKSDLFFSRLQADGSWGRPQNLGYPINTAANEGALIVSLDGKRAYFATDREDLRDADNPVGIPNSDIYVFDLYEAARPRPVTYLLAKVTDATSGAPLAAVAEVVDLQNSRRYAVSTTDLNGEVLICLPAGRNYALNVDKRGYLFYSEHFGLRDSFSLQSPFLLEVPLSPIPAASDSSEYTRPVVLRNVFFATGSAKLLPSSKTELDRLVALLEQNPALRIRINGHTDNVGSAEDNQLLSEARAGSVMAYLIEAGISETRLSAKGFGEEKPVAPNDTAAGRSQNRRTEFELIR